MSALFHACPKCGAPFRVPAELQRHLERQRPCVVQSGECTTTQCQHCGQLFSHRSNMLRHKRLSCPLAPGSKKLDRIGAERVASRAPPTLVERLAEQEARIGSLERLVSALCAHVGHVPEENLPKIGEIIALSDAAGAV